MHQIGKYIGITMLAGAIVFNLWLYRLEPAALTDPNDNSFQYGLVDRTNQTWDFASKKCSSNYLTFGICHLSFLVDHWVPNWAQGYNLPFYYSHLPQIAIVASYRFLQLFSVPLTLYAYYHLIIYLLLSLFPLTVFLSLRLIRLPWLTSGFGALIASHISTDGLYGLDPPSYLWRGWGLSSQLFAMIFLPLAIAYSWKYFSDNSEYSVPQKNRSFGESEHRKIVRLSDEALNFRHASPLSLPSFLNIFGISGLWPAVFFLVATTAGHLGIGIMAFLSLVPLAFTQPLILILQHHPLKDIVQIFKNNAIKLILLIICAGFFLSYWIVPILLNNNYHNISFWDPVWKFNSYGAKEILVRLFNGDLFDFGRLPILTLLTFLGFFAALWPKLCQNTQTTQTSGRSDGLKVRPSDSLSIRHSEFSEFSELYPYFAFALLFVFWLTLYFGRTTWGGLIDLIPGMKDFHLSRFLVGLHVTGMFLAPLGVEAIVSRILTIFRHCETPRNYTVAGKLIALVIYLFISLLLLPPVFQQTINYAQHNDRLIIQANQNYEKVKADVQQLFATLKPLPPGRIFAGRGGGWGKDFQVAETPYYMYLSAYGLPTVLWLPQTWSNNSDTEQYFSEDQIKDYELYNIRYVVAPASQKPQPFWSLMKETATWKLYEVIQTGDAVEGDNNFGYFTAGIRPAIVAVDKESFVNVARLWIQSEYPKNGLFPELTFQKDYPKNTGLPNFKMLDEATYKIPDGSQHSLFAEPPLYAVVTNPTNKIMILTENNDSDMIFSAKISVPKDCLECIFVLKQTSHPNWQVTVDGKRAERLDVFPFYNAVKVNAGEHEVTFEYKPSNLKVLLLLLELIVVGFIVVKLIFNKIKLVARLH